MQRQRGKLQALGAVQKARAADLATDMPHTWEKRTGRMATRPVRTPHQLPRSVGRGSDQQRPVNSPVSTGTWSRDCSHRWKRSSASIEQHAHCRLSIVRLVGGIHLAKCTRVVAQRYILFSAGCSSIRLSIGRSHAQSRFQEAKNRQSPCPAPSNRTARVYSVYSDALKDWRPNSLISIVAIDCAVWLF